MQTEDFLNSVLGHEGKVCLAAISTAGKVKHYFYDTIPDAAVGANTHGGTDNIFFALSRFEDQGSRKAEDSIGIRSLFLDIDCGEGKPYATKADGLHALHMFTRTASLPNPIIVDSGNGIHAYWPFNKTLSVVEWKPIADAFKEYCIQREFNVDHAVTADAARVLRLPGTLNRKYTPPSPCKVALPSSAMISVEMMDALLGDISPAPDKSKGLFGDGTTVLAIPNNTVMDTIVYSPNNESEYKRIMQKSSQGKGCEQLKLIYTDRVNLEEPRWRAGLSITKFCTDGERASALISEDYKQYSESEMRRKMSSIEGPYTCTTFDSIHPGVCPTCPHWNKIKSPIKLGQAPTAISATKTETVTYQDDEGNSNSVNVPIVRDVKPPPGYMVSNGKVYFVGFDEDTEPKQIYHNEVSVVRRIQDPVDGESLMLRLKLPMDDPREFTVPLHKTTSNDTLRIELSRQGIAAVDYTALRKYVMACVNELQNTQESDAAVRRFGWLSEKSDKFALGNRIITAGNSLLNAPTKPTAAYYNEFEPKGTLDGWKGAIGFYNRDDMALYQYMICRAFGSVLIHFIPTVHASIVHLYSQGSGLGKTTVMQAQQSVWGHPKNLISKAADTENSTFLRMEVQGDLPFCLDEFSNMSGHRASSYAMGSTDGKQKNRMSRNGNEERYRAAPWNTLITSTANESYMQIVRQKKELAIAENMRVLDIKVTKTMGVDKNEADKMIGDLQEHYGHAGPIFIRYLIRNKELIEKIIKQKLPELSAEFDLQQEHRFWAADVTATTVALAIAKQLDLLPFEIKTIKGAFAEMVGSNKRLVESTDKAPEEILADFENDHYDNFIVVHGGDDKTNPLDSMKLPVKDARTFIVGRKNVVTGVREIVQRKIKDWCAERRINYDELEEKLCKRIGARVSRVRFDKGFRTHALVYSVKDDKDSA